jgi:hypothetical protein
MYYEIMSKPSNKHITRDYIFKHKEQIIKIVDEMLKKDAPIRFTEYDIYREAFNTFAQDIIEKHTLLNEPRVEYIIPDCELVDKQILIRPKTKTIVEIMKKYSDTI